MMIPIQKVIVKDRIRKDFGNIQELADDIKENGLINPPVVNKNYELLAGERRLRACKSLGWEQIPVTMMDTRDVEHEFNIEISENDVRKGFSKSERVYYMKRLQEIESEKARDRQNLGQNSDEGGRTDDKVSHQVGISRDTMRKEMQIVENKDLLDPSDFADWDEGRLSTNKAYQKMKEKEAEKEREIKALKEELRREKEKQPEVKTVVKEVVPEDYREAKSKAKAYDAETRRLNQKLTDAYNEQNQLRDRISELEEKTSGHELHARVVEGSLLFVTACGTFVRDYGGYIWITDHLDELSQSELRDYENAIRNMYAWSSKFLDALNLGKEKMLNE